MKRYSAASIIAIEFCCDIQDIKEGQYQAGFSDRAIYVLDNDYWCAVPLGKKPAKHREIDFEWIKWKSDYIESLGWQIWTCKGE